MQRKNKKTEKVTRDHFVSLNAWKEPHSKRSEQLRSEIKLKVKTSMIQHFNNIDKIIDSIPEAQLESSSFVQVTPSISFDVNFIP